MGKKKPSRATVGIYDLKTHASAWLDQVEAGRTLQISRNGRVVAVLGPAREKSESAEPSPWTGWLAVRDRVKPLGMTMADAVREGRR